MKEYGRHVEHYRWEGFSTFSRIPREEWGDAKQAEIYLGRYWLDSDEFNKIWRPVMDKVFASEAEELPDMMFSAGFEVIPQVGGALFTEDQFESLQTCMKAVNDRHLVIIENARHVTWPPEDPPFRMKYPAHITWTELMSGNYISAMIFEATMKSFFVFGDTGLWGKYGATDYHLPLDLVGFRPDYTQVFTENFKFPEGDDEQNIREWLPPEYGLRLPPKYSRRFKQQHDEAPSS
jgi:hypothetical protein